MNTIFLFQSENLFSNGLFLPSFLNSFLLLLFLLHFIAVKPIVALNGLVLNLNGLWLNSRPLWTERNFSTLHTLVTKLPSL